MERTPGLNRTSFRIRELSFLEGTNKTSIWGDPLGCSIPYYWRQVATSFVGHFKIV